QWRYDQFGADMLSARAGQGKVKGMSTADAIAQSARLGWQPYYPTFDVNPLDLAAEAKAAGKTSAEHIVDELKGGRLRFAAGAPAAARGRSARRAPRRPARRGAGPRLPDDHDASAFGGRGAGGDLVREARSVDDGRASLRQRLRPGDLGPLAVPQRLGDLG